MTFLKPREFTPMEFAQWLNAYGSSEGVTKSWLKRKRAGPKPARRWPGVYTNVEDAAKLAHEMFPHISFDFTDMNLNVVDNVMPEFVRLAAKYPAAVAALTMVGSSAKAGRAYNDYFNSAEHKDTVWAVTARIDRNGEPTPSSQTMAIYFNSHLYGAADALMGDLKESVTDGWHTKAGGHISSIMTHEFGHVVDAVLGYENKQHWEMWHATAKPYLERTLGNPVDTSRYAAKNTQEWFAESFTMLEQGHPNLWSKHTKTMDAYLSGKTVKDALRSRKKPYGGTI